MTSWQVLYQFRQHCILKKMCYIKRDCVLKRYSMYDTSWRLPQIFKGHSKISLWLNKSSTHTHTHTNKSVFISKQIKAQLWYQGSKKQSIPSQHNAVCVTSQHLVMLDLPHLPVEQSLFLGPPAMVVSSQCDTLNAGQMGQHVSWQGCYARTGQIQLLQRV